MTGKTPPIPKEQSDHAPGQKRPASIKNAEPGPGADPNVNVAQEGRQGNIHQNVDTVRAKTQDR